MTLNYTRIAMGRRYYEDSMGQARNRGTFEERKAEAIAAGRTLEKRKVRNVYRRRGLVGEMFGRIFGPNQS